MSSVNEVEPGKSLAVTPPEKPPAETAPNTLSFVVHLDPESIEWEEDLATAFLGYPAEEMSFQPAYFDSLIHPSSRKAFREGWKSVPDKQRMLTEVCLIHRSGEPFWAQFVIVPVCEPSGKVIKALGVVHNTQALHRHTEAVSRQRYTETLANMAAGLAHEFNNLLTPVQGFIELTLDYLGKEHPMSEGLFTALDRVEHCAELISQIQAYGQKSLLRKVPVDPSALLNSVLNMAVSNEPERAERVSIIRQWPGTLPRINADSGQIQQAFLHLIQNALASMSEGGTLTVSAKPVLVDNKMTSKNRPEQLEGEFVHVKISDTGVGMSQELLAQIFDPFFTTREKQHARGMGLPTTQGLVAQHGGWLDIHSTPGEGTEVSLFFPVEAEAVAVADGVSEDSDGTVDVLPAAPVGTMMIADDERHIRTLIKRIFKKEGWTIEEAVDHDEVIEKTHAEEAPFNTILLDVTMPGPSAEESIRHIASTHPETQVLILSGYAKDERIEKLLKLGAAGFLAKPFSPAELISAVDSILART